MKLDELTVYAEEKYHISEQHKWVDFPGFSVLVSPATGKWIALLMRQWDSDSGVMHEHCDLKCGRQCLTETPAPYLSLPVRMVGSNWVGVRFDEDTRPEVIFRLFDRAVSMESGDFKGFTVVLEEKPAKAVNTYKETPLPSSGAPRAPREEEVPAKIREMRKLYQYGSHSFQQKCRNFYRQGKFMEDYEDDVPWHGEFKQYFTTYHDLSIRQLRGYFSWRTHIRKGDYKRITTSFAYMYLYELLNGIGTTSAGDSLDKMEIFKKGYLDTGIGDPAMLKNLNRWMLDFAILHNIPAETAKKYIDPELLQRDQALSVLRKPKEFSDEEIFAALCLLSGAKTAASPVILQEEERGKHLFAEIWRTLSDRYSREGQDIFTACFGEQRVYPWRPLANAVYLPRQRVEEADYLLNDCRSFRCRSGAWREERYEKLYFDRNLLQSVIRESDRKLRKYLKTGHYLREKPEDSWADPYIDRVLSEDEKARIEASRPKITIDLSGLDRIREDAYTTRDSLLTEQEKAELIEAAESFGEEMETLKEEQIEESELAFDLSIDLDPLHIQILRMLLFGDSPKEIMKTNHLMPSIVTDTINEAFFDEIGDNILECEGDEIFVIEDYTEDIREILGGKSE